MRNKILLVLTVVIVCSVVYTWRNGCNLVHKFPKIESVVRSKTIYYNKTETPSRTPGAAVTARKPKKRFPNAIIIGSKKGGTGALLSMLRSHPLIDGPKGEVHFFDQNFKRGLSWYINQMPKTKDDILTIEKSPLYFVIAAVPQRIYDMSKNVKLILIVRNPITRAVSDYMHTLMAHVSEDERSNHSFDKTIFHLDGTLNKKAHEIKNGMYDVYYERWLNRFGQKQILVVDGEELIANPVPLLQEVETFLKVPHYFENSMFVMNKGKGFYCWKKTAAADKPQCLGSSKGRAHPTISNSTMDVLTKFFRPHVQKFCYLAAVNFNWCSL